MKCPIDRKLFRNKKKIGKKTAKIQELSKYKWVPITERVSKSKENQKLTCHGRRLEDFRQCKIQPDSGHYYCRHHETMRDLLSKRYLHFQNFFAIHYENTPHEAIQFTNYLAEHCSKIFPDESTPTECKLSREMWLNKKNFDTPPLNTCCALNLFDGTNCRRGTIGPRDKYCHDHTLLKQEHAMLYHISPSDKYYPIYDTYYKGGNDGDYFTRIYLEYFLRLEHLTIYQINLDKPHADHMSKLLSQMIRQPLSESESFYRGLCKNFCAGNSYVTSIFCKLTKIFILLLQLLSV